MFTVQFGSVFIKKSNQTEFFKKKKKPKPNRNQFKPTGFGSVRFGFLEKKPVQTGLARFFPVFFPVRFGFSGSMLKKPKPNRTGRFFQNFNRFNRFFFTVRFFRLFFFGFLGFPVFLLTPILNG